MSEEKKEIDIIEVENLPIDIIEHGNYTILQSNPNSNTHGVYKYPCKFIPEIPRWAIKKYNITEGLIFDPFSGSGTTLLEGIISGNDAIGTEIDPIAKHVTKTKAKNYRKNDILDFNKDFDEINRKVALEISKDEINEYIPKMNNLEHWFNEENTVILAKLKKAIEEIENVKSQDFLYAVFLSIIKPVSNADDVSPKPYVSSKIKKTPPNAMDRFKSVYKRYIKMIEEQSKINILNTAEIADGDALKTIDQFKADLAITSPPYINAFDYPRTFRLENLWFGSLNEKEILESKDFYVGTERFSLAKAEKESKEILLKSELLEKYFNEIYEVDKKRAYIVKKFFDDMELNLINVNKHLKTNSKYIVVIGDSSIRKVDIESWKVIIDIAKYNGFEYETHFSYNIKNPYIRIPRKGRGGKIKQDQVIVLNKIGEV